VKLNKSIVQKILSNIFLFGELQASGKEKIISTDELFLVGFVALAVVFGTTMDMYVGL